MFSLERIFGSYNSRIIKKYERTVKEINQLEEFITPLSDEELRNKTFEFKTLLTSGEKTLNNILPEAFAVVREAAIRTLGLRHFDVQLIGGMALHDGSIAEMKTGEGKTLVATLAVYLNALPGEGVHVVTVNDYLAKRDANWMGQVYRFLGLSVDVIIGGMGDERKKEAYNADIVYGTNHEFGFDYLRDNLKFNESEMVMRSLNFAVIDEVDSILIDEARTPLIISGVDQGSTQLYIAVDNVVKNITNTEEFEKDEKSRVVTLTDIGVEKIEEGLKKIGLLQLDGALYDPHNISLVYHVNCALRAHKLFSKDVDYIVKDRQVMIIDEFTGRIMDGRRYSEGLHQALEAKEHVEVKTESQTIATISYQNLFRLYKKLSGMTGTAMTEEAEFGEIYKLNVVSIPPNKPVIRKDQEDSIFLTLEEKDKSAINLIKDCIVRQQPVLIGTTNIDRSEYFSNLLKKEGIRHNVLNARHHEKEAYIIAEAGVPGAVTIATNMAGRGTDIKLGGSFEMRVEMECANITDQEERRQKMEEIKEDIAKKYEIVANAGGLFIVGTERNESRRIDNQLRGRSGRQGDPGASKFFLSLEDELIKRFGSANFSKTLQRAGVQKNDELTHRWISKAIEKSQQRVEAYNFDIRKQLLRYDDVMNDQRKIIYEQRKALMDTKDLTEFVFHNITDSVAELVGKVAQANTVPDEWDISLLKIESKKLFGIDTDVITINPEMTPESLSHQLEEIVFQNYNKKLEKYGADMMNYMARDATLKTLDQAWRKHLVVLEHLRRGVNLRAYAQKNPLNEYKLEAFELFQDMLTMAKDEGLSLISNFEIKNYQSEPIIEEPVAIPNEEIEVEPIIKATFISRNDTCSCGSGLKFKYCCGSIDDKISEKIIKSAEKKKKIAEAASKREVEIEKERNIVEIEKPKVKIEEVEVTPVKKTQESTVATPAAEPVNKQPRKKAIINKAKDSSVTSVKKTQESTVVTPATEPINKQPRKKAIISKAKDSAVTVTKKTQESTVATPVAEPVNKQPRKKAIINKAKDSAVTVTKKAQKNTVVTPATEPINKQPRKKAIINKAKDSAVTVTKKAQKSTIVTPAAEPVNKQPRKKAKDSAVTVTKKTRKKSDS
ncbi:MAG: preprotein translocase subunit SecA [Holosporales bacterium]|jgi:preprotein translocase subunit SecA|nr:preprotein translocase subunit SecA [Holosporales bacterium]